MELFKEGEHLTEAKLGQMLELLVGKENLQRQYKIENYKVDFLVWGKLVIEFDGFRHYNVSKVIERDYKVTGLCKNNGFDFMSVPYFIQWPYVCKVLGYNEEDFGYRYPNGFISEAALTPKDFNIQGLIKFVFQLRSFTEEIRDNILETMDENDMICYNHALGML